MNPTYMRTICRRLNDATKIIAERLNCKVYPQLQKDVSYMTDTQVMKHIHKQIAFFQAPDYSHIMFNEDIRR